MDENGLVDSIGGHFYHGTLIHRSVIEQLGVTLEWLFFRGEEVEYGLRIMRAGYPILSVPASVVYHPEMSTVSLRAFGKTKFFEVMSPLKRYYSIRNSMWVRRVYYPDASLFLYAARRLGGTLLAELWLAPNKAWQERFAACGAAMRAIMDGARMQPPENANR